MNCAQKPGVAVQVLFALLCSLSFVATAHVGAADWPQFLGPQRNGISAETGVIENWQEGGPKEVWRAKGGVGMAGLAISGGKLATLVQKEGQQWLILLD